MFNKGETPACTTDCPNGKFRHGLQEGIQGHDGLEKAFEEDPLLGGFDQSELDVVLAIAISNQQAKGYTHGEVGAGNGAFTKKVRQDPTSMGAGLRHVWTATPLASSDPHRGSTST